MGERRNKTVCAFELKSPRISACDIHEWIYAQMSLNENEVTMQQIDGTKVMFISSFATKTDRNSCSV
jgi:hypothetical protein